MCNDTSKEHNNNIQAEAVEDAADSGAVAQVEADLPCTAAAAPDRK